MNGYLGHLVEHTLGMLPTLQPRTRSRFEPVSETSVDGLDMAAFPGNHQAEPGRQRPRPTPAAPAASPPRPAPDIPAATGAAVGQQSAPHDGAPVHPAVPAQSGRDTEAITRQAQSAEPDPAPGHDPARAPRPTPAHTATVVSEQVLITGEPGTTVPATVETDPAQRGTAQHAAAGDPTTNSPGRPVSPEPPTAARLAADSTRDAAHPSASASTKARQRSAEPGLDPVTVVPGLVSTQPRVAEPAEAERRSMLAGELTAGRSDAESAPPAAEPGPATSTAAAPVTPAAGNVAERAAPPAIAATVAAPRRAEPPAPEPPPPPTVTVTIGRVEIHPPPAPLPEPQPIPGPAPGPTPLSLDEYLERRGGRAR
ncbi:MAG: hypothetical protein ACRDRV_09475 [Pseudonocardiaceae bacterium]